MPNPAFPGAEGYGAVTQGARAGGGTPTIYTVSNLNNSGSGSFRAACEASGPRVVVFNVAGYIELSSTIRINNPYITILGQTAPAPGIILVRSGSSDYALMDINADEVIIRYLRMFHGQHYDNQGKSGDCMKIGDDQKLPENLIIDHCEFGGATDETVSFWDGGGVATMQWCIIHDPIHNDSQEENLAQGHGHGTIIRNKKVSLHHNLFVCTRNRTPARVKSRTTDTTEIVANVMYNMNWLNDGDWGPLFIRNDIKPEDVSTTQNVNIVNNVFQIGPNRASKSGGYVIDIRKQQSGTINVYEDGTLILEEDGRDMSSDSDYGPFRPGHAGTIKTSAISVGHSYAISTDNAASEYERVLKGAGVTVPQRWKFTVDMIKGVRNGTRRWVNRDEVEIGWPPPVSAASSWTDTDGDGIPDYYELEKSGTTTGLTAANTAASGYLYVEEWANSLSGDVAPTGGDPDTGGSGGGGNNDNADGGETTVEPSDDVTINDGTTTYYDTASTTLFVGNYDATEYNYRCLIRKELDIERGSTVDEAILKIYVKGINTACPPMYIYALAEDDAAAFGTEANTKTRAASLTTAYATWDPNDDTLDNVFVYTTDLSTVIEEVVGRAGWERGNSIAFVIVPQSGTYSTQERIKFASVDDDVLVHPVLLFSGVVEPGPVQETESGTVNLSIAASGDDGYIVGETSAFDNTNVKAYAGDKDTVYDYTTFLRFDNATIPNGATITSAILNVEMYNSSGSEFSLLIDAEDADDPAAPTTYADAAGRTHTTAEVAWSVSGYSSGTRINSPDISTVIQEVVDRVGWASGNAIQIFIQDESVGDSGVDRRMGIATYDDSPTHVATLAIEYTTQAEGSTEVATNLIDEDELIVIRKGSTPTVVFFLADETDRTTAETGKSPTVAISKNGGSFATSTNSASEIAYGWYSVALTATETNTAGPLIVRPTAAGCATVAKAYWVIGDFSDWYETEPEVTMSATNMNLLADHILRRDLSNTEAASGPDTFDRYSALGTFLRIVGVVSTSGGVVTVKETDGSTTAYTLNITTSTSAELTTGQS